MAETELDHFIDAFGNRVEVGDAVVYILGERTSKRFAKGVVERIGHNEERTFSKTKYYIRCTEDNGRYMRREGGLSPMEHTNRIMKVDSRKDGV